MNLRTIKDGFSGTDDRHIGQYIVVGKKATYVVLKRKSIGLNAWTVALELFAEKIMF